MRISDWSSDVCSSDLLLRVGRAHRADEGFEPRRVLDPRCRFYSAGHIHRPRTCRTHRIAHVAGVQATGKAQRQIGRASCRERAVRVDLGGRRIIKTKKMTTSEHIESTRLYRQE